MAKNVGICFSREFSGLDPLGHIGPKLPVYLRLLEMMWKKSWRVFVLTKRTYNKNGTFIGCWEFRKGRFYQVFDFIKIDLVFDRTGGISFPVENDKKSIFVNEIEFKILCCDKYLTYKKIGKYMAKTFLLNSEKDLKKVLPEIKTKWVVLKPTTGLKGMGIFIGPKTEVEKFKFHKKYSKYIVQEFIDTSTGISGITDSLHDLRVVITNNKPVWCTVRVPKKGNFKANVAEGGAIREIDYSKVPDPIKKIVKSVSNNFFRNYSNPIFSLDFGMTKKGPKIIEINDQIGFPGWKMKARDIFLGEIIKNFELKLKD